MDQQEREEDVVSDMGCHFTWPELKRLDRMDLHRERLILQQEQLDFKKLPTRTLAITNLLGFLDYSLHEQDQGIRRFQDVLVLDTCNVTAISCLMIIYKRHGLLTQYQKHAAKLQQVLCANNPVTLARAFVDRALATKQFQKDDRRFTYMPYLVKAISKGKHVVDNLEKAEWQFEYAHCLARRDEQNVLCKAPGPQMASVLRDAVQSFFNVIKLAEGDKLIVPKTWANLGNILLRKPNRYFQDILPHERELNGMTAFDCFKNALKLSQEDADVLCIIGKGYAQMKKYKEALELLQASLRLRDTQTAHRQCGLIYLQLWKARDKQTNHPGTSHLETVSADNAENSVEYTICSERVTLMEQNTDIHVCGDRELSNDIPEGIESIQLDERTTQSSGHSKENQTDDSREFTRLHSLHKVSINIDGDSKTLSHQESQTEEQLLLKAKDSFTQAMRQKATHADHSSLGYVLFLLGDLHQSIQHFSMAIKFQEGDSFDTSVTHGRWAKCLEMLNEMQGARIQRDLQRQVKAIMKDRAPSVGESWRYTHGTNCQGFECDLSRFNYCKTGRPGFINILSEYNKSPTSPNIGFFLQPKITSEFKNDFFVSFAHIDHRWAVSFVYKLEKDFPGLTGVLRYRDYELGATIADNIANSVENSYRTLIILSPDSLRDQWCRYEINRAHMTHLNRSCVIPIMLRTCKMPREIEHLSVVRCDQGQIKKDDWDRLGRSLRQTENTDASEY